jgi:lipopolysaccharide/colanic/teichoic acid biosynthesis glycosyltransferase
MSDSSEPLNPADTTPTIGINDTVVIEPERRDSIPPLPQLVESVPQITSHPWFPPRRRGTQDFVILPSGNRSWAYRTVKRTCDIVGALLLLTFLWPLMLATYVVLYFTTKGHPLFFQDRVGLCGREFRMYKFRTMVMDAQKLQHLVQNEKDGPIFKNQRDPRITRLGRLLRSTSIDELPQIFSVLKGDMALVGPRPPVPSEVARYKPWQRTRLTVKPGLTCLWQVSGRCEIGFDDWVRMDIWYQRNQGLGTDLELMAKTPGSVISRRGAY